MSLVKQNDAISELSQRLQPTEYHRMGKWLNTARTSTMWHSHLCSVKYRLQAVCSCLKITCRRLWYSGLGSSPRNSLHIWVSSPVHQCINRSPVWITVVIFSNHCNTFSCQHTQMGMPCKSTVDMVGFEFKSCNTYTVTAFTTTRCPRTDKSGPS
jgi:hypothetical protein